VNPLLVISERDNVATALEPLEPGRLVTIGAASLTILELIPGGHKVALTDIPAGQALVKYGSAIGVASVRIPAGAHVHVHNVMSARGRGDLARPTPAGEARLAEPSDVPELAVAPSLGEPNPV
jgi:predicted RecA/RadA family phage recombinase